MKILRYSLVAIIALLQLNPPRARVACACGGGRGGVLMLLLLVLGEHIVKRERGGRAGGKTAAAAARVNAADDANARRRRGEEGNTHLWAPRAETFSWAQRHANKEFWMFSNGATQHRGTTVLSKQIPSNPHITAKMPSYNRDEPR